MFLDLIQIEFNEHLGGGTRYLIHKIQTLVFKTQESMYPTDNDDDNIRHSQIMISLHTLRVWETICDALASFGL